MAKFSPISLENAIFSSLNNRICYKPKYEMQDIFRLYRDDYIARHKLNSIQLKAIRAITAYRNRNRPKCQGEKHYEWIENGLNYS